MGRRVKAELIRKGGGSKSPKKKSKYGSDSDMSDDDDDKEFEEDDKVEARFGGKDKWFKGKITRKRSDGTYDILYEDGDSERRVKAELIRKVGGSKSPKKKKKSKYGSDSDMSDDDDDKEFEEDDEVEAR